MNYVKAKSNWEEIFIQEAIDLEEKMSSLDLSAFEKSRIRLALENDILSWKKYQLWLTTELQCPSLPTVIADEHLEKLINTATSTLETYSNYNFWSEDLIPIDTWDENLIVIGLEKSEKLIEIPKAIFILASPQVLSQFSGKLFGNAENADPSSSESSADDADSKIDLDAMLDGIDLNASVSTLQFNSASLKESISEPIESMPVEIEASPLQILTEDDDSNNESSYGLPSTASSMWEYLSERHDEYCFEVKKQFDAYLVLKINGSRTQIFKMDADLKSENLNPQLFEYSLDDENPFKKVLVNGHSESFNINQLGFQILDYRYVCITPLKRSDITVGFLVGLKTSNMAENDQSLLEDLAKESA